jgi:hypothetical protein
MRTLSIGAIIVFSLAVLGLPGCHGSSSSKDEGAATSTGDAQATGAAAPTDGASVAGAGSSASSAGGDAAAGSAGGMSFVGIAFVDSTVTGQGSRAQLPSGTQLYPSGTKISGTIGCPTNRYGTDGLIVAVIDYEGRPTSASLKVTRHPAGGGQFTNALYYLDLDPGRKLQYLGPINDNGTYDIEISYDYAQGAAKSVHGRFELDRSCPGIV